MVRTLRSVLHGLATISGAAPRSWRVAAVLGVALLIGAASVTAAAVQDPIAWLGVPGGHLLWQVLRWPLVLLALFGWAVLVLRSGVRRRNRRALVAAGALAVGGWVLASALYPVYVSVAANVAQGLGALGGGLILLDVAIEHPVPGECFAVRGGELARRVAADVGAGPDTSRALGDAVARHATPDLEPRVHPHPYLVATGALVDVLGKRLEQLGPRFVADVQQAHPRDGFSRVVAAAWRNEVASVPRGRAALAEHTTACSLAARFAPTH